MVWRFLIPDILKLKSQKIKKPCLALILLKIKKKIRICKT